MIAIVEDDNLLALVMSKFLSLEGYQIATFSRGEDLLKAMKSEEFKPKAVVLDVKLKGDLTGIELSKILPENLPIIFCTGNSDHDFLKKNDQSNVKGVLIKPIELKELLALLAEII
jgi:DNA-binding NtrC family response regulator